MRFIPTPCLREGMVIAKSLLGKDGSLLLQKGQGLRKSYISHIIRLGYNGVYIFDNLSEEIVVESVIDDELRSSAVKAISDIYIQSQSVGLNHNVTDEAKGIIHDLVDEIINNRNIMVNMIDLKSFDDYTYYHSVSVTVLSLVMGVALGMGKTELFKLGLGALLHDVGKIFVDKDIIEKPNSLTPDEFDQVKKHPQEGYQYLNNANLDLPATSLMGVLQHHERYDGSGYPEGISGKKITQFGRVIAIADVYDAMTSDRPYRVAMMPSEVMEYLMGGAGTLFDPDMVYLFTRKVAAYPLGTCVLLSNGLTAIVVENYEDCCTRPKVKVVCSYEAVPIYFDLKNDRRISNLTITGVVKM
jgi:HD-GYP domain-containing protein (c-di-GMP phosphodiesterase class II)